MAVKNLANYTDKDGLGFPLNFRRGNPNPLDNSSLWGTLAAAQTYAQSDPTAYVGQILTVLNADTDSATVYVIEKEDGTLKQLGNVESIAQLEATVNALSQKVGTIPEGATATTVVGYVDEKVGTIPEGSDNVVDYVDKQIAAIPAQTDYTVTITTPTEDSVSKRYNIKQVSTGLDVNIDIPKDMVVSSGTVETKATEGAWGPAGTYLVLTLANATSDKVYINVGDLIEYVVGGTATDGIITTTVTVDGTGNHVLTATINDGTITLTKLAEDVQTAIGKAHTHTNKAVLDGITADKVAGWDTAATDAHTHTNKTVLDGITAEKVSNWDAAQANVLEGITSTGSITVGTITNKKVNIDIEWGTF